MVIYIRNMVSLRCKILVKQELEQLGVPFIVIDLGEVKLTEKISSEKRLQLKETLLKSGLEVMEDKKSIIIEKIKNVVIEIIHYADELPKVNFSTYLSEKLHHDYTYLSNIFSATKGMTIEHYIIMQKVEKVKELLLYDELTLAEIADRLHYSSSAHLCNQFKKITGLTPTFFRSMKDHKRICLEDV
jgi:AraC-like DNA-binding protein